ncbi:MAG: hypothetical protein LBV32_02605 [Tannerellaceae bacterium]|nr:hypothetical protein [Tannerellaceae bacterium]
MEIEDLWLSLQIKEILVRFNWLSESKNRIPVVIRYIIENELEQDNEKGEMDIRIAETIPLSYLFLGDLTELYFPEIIDRIRSQEKFDLENGGLENYIDNADRRKVYLIREVLKKY